MAEDTVTISAKLPAKTLAILRDLAAQRGTTVADALRGAIEIASVLTTAEKKGSKVLIRDPDKTFTQIILK